MNIEEQYLREKLSPETNPFRVPEGYFDQLTERVMRNIPMEEAKDDSRKAPRSRWWIYAAASVLVAVFSVALYFHDGSDVNQSANPTVAMTSTDDSFDEATDYVMMDNQDIYACLMDY